MDYRLEKDSMGEILVPADRLWGAQTQRSRENFPIGGERMPIGIQEDEYFFGDMGNKHWGGARGYMWIGCDIENTWPIQEDGLHHAPLDDPFYYKQLLAISPEDVKELREIAKERAHFARGFEIELVGPERFRSSV